MEKFSNYPEETQAQEDQVSQRYNSFTNNVSNYYNFHTGYLQNYSMFPGFQQFTSYPSQSYIQPVNSAEYYQPQVPLTSSPSSTDKESIQNLSTPPGLNFKGHCLYPTPPSDKESLNKTDCTDANSRKFLTIRMHLSHKILTY